MKKVVLALVLTFVFSINLNASNVDVANRLQNLGIISGYEDGSFKLDQKITRAEMSKVIYKVVNTKYNIKFDMYRGYFKDISKDYWAREYIETLKKEKIIGGYPGDVFKPYNNITYVETLALLIRSIDKEHKLNGDWPYNYINLAFDLNIISNKKVSADKILTRGEVFNLVWNSLTVE